MGSEQIEIKTYEELKKLLTTSEDPNIAKYKNFLIEKEDLEEVFGFTIFDVESNDKNKTLSPIAMCYDLADDYKNSCLYLVSNTDFFPGALELYVRSFIIVKKLNLCMMFNHMKEDVILYEYVEDKEDGKVLCKRLKYCRDEFQMKNLYLAITDYLGVDKVRENLQKANENFSTHLKSFKYI